MTIPKGTTQLPPQLSTLAADVDWLYNLVYWITVVGFVLVTGFMVYCLVKYRRKPGVKASVTGHSTALEIAWTFSPLILLAYLFHAGFQGYIRGAIAPEDAIEIRVRAMQWNWEFEYPNGMVEMNKLTVPVDQPVKLIMSSSDVLHSFFVPEFRLKRDVVPGLYTTLWFEATELTGDRPITVFCAEYCGAPLGITDGTVATGRNSNHSTMLAALNIVPRAEYEELMEQGPAMPAQCEGHENPAACWGEDLYAANGCRACHSTEAGVDAPAPSWAGLFGSERSFTDGSTKVADENYIAQSIREPQVLKVDGYGAVNMPPFRLSDRQVDAIIAFMRTLPQE
jgi:cytochrome c oxidase subunit 2